ncbi:MAG: hypothetical protein KJ646_02390 [Nanoarchaeota archaeon]|nr:hypothetical protein [Candidatus Woesearchaeota archaeon]MBU4069806.1 hypothetical protein [Nanoarchaeota archaeon]
MFNETKIEKKIDIKEFLDFINDYKEEQIECTEHTFFRLSEKQRKIYTCNKLKRIITKEKPFLAGIQYNKNYAVFYKYKNRNLKIIVNLDNTKIKIVTFYFIEEWQIPKI